MELAILKSCYRKLREVERELGAQADQIENSQLRKLEAATRRLSMRVLAFVAERPDEPEMNRPPEVIATACGTCERDDG